MGDFFHDSTRVAGRDRGHGQKFWVGTSHTGLLLWLYTHLGYLGRDMGHSCRALSHWTSSTTVHTCKVVGPEIGTWGGL